MIAWEKKYFSCGKFAEGKTPIIRVTFLVKKNPDNNRKMSLQ